MLTQAWRDVLSHHPHLLHNTNISPQHRPSPKSFLWPGELDGRVAGPYEARAHVHGGPEVVADSAIVVVAVLTLVGSGGVTHQVTELPKLPRSPQVREAFYYEFSSDGHIKSRVVAENKLVVVSFE